LSGMNINEKVDLPRQRRVRYVRHRSRRLQRSENPRLSISYVLANGCGIECGILTVTGILDVTAWNDRPVVTEKSGPDAVSFSDPR
jgi:hypothetical protein